MRGTLREWARALAGRPRVPAIVRKVRAEGLTYLNVEALTELQREVRWIEEAGLEGILIEAGCALGGSAIVMAAAKSPDRAMHVFDVFGMIPPPSELDGEDVHRRYEVIQSGQSDGIDGGRYYGYEEDLRQRVTGNFQRLGYPIEENHVELVEGLFQDTLKPAGPVALAHLDGDWYESVMTCLQRIVPRLVRGGRLVIDDYHTWSGCRRAVDQYFERIMPDFRFEGESRLHIVRA
ncbi:MAG TPA: TylF/MycF/NovP-related O-methyltransferase [Gemmatimonadales bacterium]|nr:TylF/MycF/NovP-related O-methyltransferase [Gemmatimonadales bacterium]